MQGCGKTSFRPAQRCRGGIALIAVLASAPAGCAVVPPGYTGVLLTPSGGMHALGEGVHIVPPMAQVHQYDLRGQERDENLLALTADGAPVAARASLVTYHLVPSELITVDRRLGPDYYRIVIQPVVRSTVRRVLAWYHSSQLYSSNIVRAQQEITQLATERLRPYHIVIDSVDLRTLGVVLSQRAYASVTERGVLEQQALAMPQSLELARQQAEARREEARAIAAAHALVAPTLTPNVLDDSRRRAEEQLLGSAASTVVVVEPGQPYQLEVVP